MERTTRIAQHHMTFLGNIMRLSRVYSSLAGLGLGLGLEVA